MKEELTSILLVSTSNQQLSSFLSTSYPSSRQEMLVMTLYACWRKSGTTMSAAVFSSGLELRHVPSFSMAYCTESTTLARAADNTHVVQQNVCGCTVDKWLDLLPLKSTSCSNWAGVIRKADTTDAHTYEDHLPQPESSVHNCWSHLSRWNFMNPYWTSGLPVVFVFCPWCCSESEDSVNNS